MENELNEFMVVKDETGILRPLVGIWPVRKLEYYQPDIDKFMVRGSKEGLKIVKIKMIEI